MGQSTFNISMDENLKKEFDALCVGFGMNASTAFNIFAKAVVREKKIPFEISVSSQSNNLLDNLEKGKNAFLSLRQQAQDSTVSDLSLEQINEEINLTRKGL